MAITRWQSADSIGLNEPGEGSEATFYHANGHLERVLAKHHGENGQRRAEYYLLNGQPFFVLEKAYTYNRPIYYDAANAKATGDEAFDFKKSTVVESRSYFAHGQLLRQLPAPPSGPAAADSLRHE